MKKIGLISDTHNHWDVRYEKYFAECDEIWHAGDIGSLQLAEQFEAFKPFRAVYGNIDDFKTRAAFPEFLRFTTEGVDVLMSHIVGYPEKYYPAIRSILKANPPKLLIAGHSHILKVMFDKRFNCLFINPGAAGIYGFHSVRTLVRFTINEGNIADLDVIELK